LRCSSIHLHNLEFIQTKYQFEMIFFPAYLNWKDLLFAASKQVSLIPANEHPEELSSEAMDAALKTHLFQTDVLEVKSFLIVPVEVQRGRWFNAAFWIAAADFSQFRIDASTQISIASRPELRKLPSQIQRSLSSSWILPQAHLFVTFPRSGRFTEFLGSASWRFGLLSGALGSGKRTLIYRVVDELGIPALFFDLQDFSGKAEADKIVAKVEEAARKGAQVVVFDGAELLKPTFKLHSLLHKLSTETAIKVVFILHGSKVPDHLKEIFDFVQEFKATPNRKEAAEMFQEIQAPDHDLLTEFSGFGLSIGEFSELAALKSDFAGFKQRLQLRRRLRLTSSEIPRVTWDQVAGLTEAKQTLASLISKITARPRPSGILLHGPPGTGKTLLAKALATESHFSFLAVKGPELLSPYIGESEAALREVFAQARAQAPCILFFDELDALVPKRGEFGDSVGVADRLVSTFMLEMDEISGMAVSSEDSEDCVLVLGATNRPDLIDASLMRSGRFDVSLFLGPPRSNSERAAILEASCKALLCTENVDFKAVFQDAQQIELSPAQIASVARIAAERALERKIAEFREGQEGEALLIAPLSTDRLKEALNEVLSGKQSCKYVHVQRPSK
jgi:AAA+ superfamily predicted ATPase